MYKNTKCMNEYLILFVFNSGDKDTATERKLRAFVTDSLGDEYDRIMGFRCACKWLRSKPNVIDLGINNKSISTIYLR